MENAFNAPDSQADARAEQQDLFGADNRPPVKLGIILFVGVGLLAIGILLWDALSQQARKPLTHSKDVAYQAPTHLNGPHIEVDQVQEKSEDAGRQKRLNTDEARLRAAALELARKQQQSLKIRRESHQLIFDHSAEISAAVTGPKNSASLGEKTAPENTSLGGNKQVTHKEDKRVAARQLPHLSSLIAQGTIIDAVMETALQSDLPGMLRAVVSEDVYSYNGDHVLLPRGSRLIGRYRSSLKRGQARVFVIWNRALRPDGVSVQLAAQGTDDLGRAGLTGKVETHFFKRFGASALLSILDAGLQAGVNTTQQDAADQITLNTGRDFSKAAELALENSIAIPPTINITQGSRIKVFVARDLDFSSVKK